MSQVCFCLLKLLIVHWLIRFLFAVQLRGTGSASGASKQHMAASIRGLSAAADERPGAPLIVVRDPATPGAVTFAPGVHL